MGNSEKKHDKRLVQTLLEVAYEKSL